ncbi:MAG: hypothetical protein KDD01_22555 [Phaeodactylibacter sp.]|nr:hypothetical protein [Phaeodactylibacter sp.]
MRRFDGPDTVKLNALLLPPGQVGYIAIGQVTDVADGNTALAWVEVDRASGALIRLKRYSTASRYAVGADAFIFGSQVFSTGPFKAGGGARRGGFDAVGGQDDKTYCYFGHGHCNPGGVFVRQAGS